MPTRIRGNNIASIGRADLKICYKPAPPGSRRATPSRSLGHAGPLAHVIAKRSGAAAQALVVYRDPVAEACHFVLLGIGPNGGGRCRHRLLHSGACRRGARRREFTESNVAPARRRPTCLPACADAGVVGRDARDVLARDIQRHLVLRAAPQIPPIGAISDEIIVIARFVGPIFAEPVLQTIIQIAIGVNGGDARAERGFPPGLGSDRWWMRQECLYRGGSQNLAVRASVDDGGPGGGGGGEV
ncbi:hypothetical protein MCOR27_005607 [Pyricularia oryzae]|uniref:Uncharacterized protein n=1 Tax=Pyricularia grisea TaxID=148305 RepID=A0ABQ8N995_PYRGI|nr:hypothetical protein MCOR01_007372 [Pyricularia oryzae]KAI6293371.1 hypothetical protein MCOR33_009198 [Pyricularia grisea]KAI6278449.1 hypothetical protein MCOR27_005607 [Pyricularia oryzae]KAI6348748.1 hypothetical protein MCOR30_000020 [Pyricularia oryzae]KAI6397786.1 hypothetical protein MCOR20_009444 [Pyricularia oryzae]